MFMSVDMPKKDWVRIKSIVIAFCLEHECSTCPLENAIDECVGCKLISKISGILAVSEETND